MKKVAIVGYATSRIKAPYDDPSFEIWGMNTIFYKIPRITRWFEMHFQDISRIEPEIYRTWLFTQIDVPVYMLKEYDEVPASVSYPKAQMIQEFGNHFNCSVTWMLAMAISEGFKEVHFYGVHADPGTEYEKQRECIAFFIGVMHGRGIKYVIPAESHLLRNEVLYGYNERIYIDEREVHYEQSCKNKDDC